MHATSSKPLDDKVRALADIQDICKRMAIIWQFCELNLLDDIFTSVLCVLSSNTSYCNDAAFDQIVEK